MYTTFFGLRELPFPLANDPHFFYPTPATQKAEQRIVTALQQHSGLVLLTGEPGTGKTTILHRIAMSLEPQTSILLLPFSALTFDDILTHVCDQFSITPANNDQFTKVLAIQEHLQNAAEGGMPVVLCIDEAQNLRKETLDRLRLLLHLKGPNGKLLQILLVGQQPLETKLAHPDLRHIQQYITVHCRLEPLTRDAVRSFILHRLRVAGCDRLDLFTPDAIESVAHYSQYVPRLINVICDNALIAAYLARSQTISRNLIENVARNLQLNGETTINEPQRARAGNQSAQRTVPSPQPLRHRWVSNLIWTGAGVVIAWFSSSPQPFSVFPLNFFFATKGAQVLLPSATPTTEPLSPALLPRQSQPQLTLTHGETSPPALNAPIASPAPLSAAHTDRQDTAPILEPVQPSAPAVQAQGTSRVTEATSGPLSPAVQPSQQFLIAPPPAISSTPDKQTTPLPGTLATHQLSGSRAADPMVSPAVLAESNRIDVQPPQYSPRPLQAPKVSRSPHTREAAAALMHRGHQPTREALFRAVTINDVQEVDLLLTAHAPVNAKDARGWTALMIAARDNHPDLVRLLLSRGAVVNLTNQEGETALMHAADNDHLTTVQILLEHGASIDTKSNLGWTALMYAAAKGHRLTVEILLGKGANAGIRDNDGRTASMYAIRQATVRSQEDQLRGPTAFRNRLGRLDTERLELVKRRDYSEIASLLKEAEGKK